MRGILYPVALTDIDKTIGDYANRDETIKKVNKEIETHTEGANIRGATFAEYSTQN